PPTTQSIAIPAEQPTAVNRTTEVVGIVSIGLVLGALAFLLFLAISGALRAFASRERPAPIVSAEAPAPSRARPAWLETADPPRARVERTAAESPRPVAERPVRTARADGAGSSAIEVADIDYSPDAARRVAPLRLSRRPCDAPTRARYNPRAALIISARPSATRSRSASGSSTAAVSLLIPMSMDIL